MKLNNLHRLKALHEDRINPIDAHRLPPIQQYKKALPFRPAVKFEEKLEELNRRVLPEKNPEVLQLGTEEQLKMARDAYRKVSTELRRNIISGLEKDTYWDAARKVDDDPNGNIVIVADVDNTKWLNSESGLTHHGANTILRTIGDLFNENFSYVEPDTSSGVTGSGIRNTRCFHPHGDEFRVFSNIRGLSRKYASNRLLALLRAAVHVSNSLASYGFTHSDDPLVDDSGTQATITIAVSNGLKEANALLRKAKESSKYAIVVDADLMDRLSFKEYCNKGLKDLLTQTNYPVILGENQNKALDMLKQQTRGVILMECGYSGIPHQDRLDLEREIEERLAYLREPRSVLPIPIGPHNYIYIPINESYSGL